MGSGKRSVMATLDGAKHNRENKPHCQKITVPSLDTKNDRGVDGLEDYGHCSPLLLL